MDAVMVGADGTEIPFGFEYTELSPPGRLVLSFAEPREDVPVTLEASEGGAALTYEFVSWPAPEDVATSQRGVETMLDTIEDGITQGII